MSSSGTGQNVISIAVLRNDAQSHGYRIINVYDIELESVSSRRGPSEGGNFYCDAIDSEDAVFVRQEDLLGFVCGERVRILFTGTTSSGGMLRVYNITIHQGRRKRESPLLGIGSVQADQFESVNQTVTPLLRVIMSKFIQH